MAARGRIRYTCPMQVWRRLVWALALVALACGLYQGRRAFVRAIFVDGAGAPAVADAVAPGARVRVVLIDGLGLEPARSLPNLNALCARGLDLEVDAGFPTVSLPVQSVLWTGRTQQQSGVQYRQKAIDPPPADALPALVPGSEAVAESHAFIVRSFGFATARPAPEAETTWSEAAFVDAAEGLAGGDAPLGLVHVLRVDDAGHAHGGASAAYREAAAWSDALLGRLLATDRAAHGEGTRWLVLSDHGHLPEGGHGDAEPALRRVRACLVGGVAPGTAGPVPLASLARALRSGGAPAAAETALPSPGAARWTLAVALLVAGVATGGRRAWLALWLPVALASVVAIAGWPSLSRRFVWPPLGLDVAKAALPGLVLLAAGSWRALRRASAGQVVVAGLAPALALAAAAAALCWGAPPLMPVWTAWTSVALVVAAAASLAVAVALVVPGGRRPR